MWEKYLEYLKMWAESHKDEEFQGMTPACYDEFVEVYSEIQQSLMTKKVEFMKSWIWEHCATDVDYVLALRYAKFAEDEMYTELQDGLGYSKAEAEEVMIQAKKHF